MTLTMRKAFTGMESEYAVMRKASRGTVRGAILVALTASLGSCQPGDVQHPVLPLEQRVRAFWEARVQGDDLAAYQYEIYTHTGKMTATQYIKRRSPLLKYTEYAIEEIQEQEKEAQVRVDVKYQLTFPGITELSLDSEVKERWTRLDDGQWYRNNWKDKLPRPSRAAAKQG